MNLNNLINEKVTHTTFGDGQIINITKSNVSVKFTKGGVQFFSFPNTFKNNVIRFISVDHDEVLKEIDEHLAKKDVGLNSKPQEAPAIKEAPVIIKEEKPVILKEEFVEEVKPTKEEEVVLEPVFEEEKEEVILEDAFIEEKEARAPFIYDASVNSEQAFISFSEEKEDYVTFKEEFKEYFEEKRLLSYLVFKYVNCKEVYMRIKLNTQEIILRTLTEEPTEYEKWLVTLFIAMIAHKEYDGSMWPYIEQELEELYVDHNQLEINKAIRKLITNNELGGESSVLIHAGVFVKYYKDYYSLMYDIFKLNFKHNLTNAPIEDILADTFKGLKDELLEDDGDTVYIKLTDTTYYLAKYTKEAMIISPEEMAKVMKRLLRHIDLWYHDNKYDKNEIELHRALKLWLDIEADKISKIIVDRKPYINEPQYSFNHNTMEMSLTIPKINISSLNNIDYKRLEIIVKEGRSKTPLAIDIDYRIYQLIGYFSINIRDYIVKNPFLNIDVTVLYNKKIIYKTEEALNKDIYVFNEKGKELVNQHSYTGHLYIVHNPKEQFQGAKEYPFGTHKISYLNINNGQTLKLKEEQAKERKELTLGLNGVLVEDLEAKVNKNPYPVYKELKSIVFRSNLKAKDMVLCINRKRRSLSQIVKEDNMYSQLFDFEIDLLKLNLHSDIYNIEINDLENNTIESFRFILDKNIKIIQNVLNAPFEHNFVLESSFKVFDDKPSKYNLEVDNDLRFSFKFNSRLVEYNVLIDLPRFKYTQKDKWMLLDDVELISNELFTTNDIVEVIIQTNEEDFSLEVKRRTRGYKVYDLSPLKTKYLNEKILRVVFVLSNDERVKHYLYKEPTIVGKPKEEFTEDGALKLVFDIKLFDPEKWILEITDPFGGKKSVNLTSKEVIADDFIPFKEHTITIKDKQNILYGVKMSNFYEKKFIITDTFSLYGKTFKIDSAKYLNKESKQESVKIKNLAIHFKQRIKDTEACIDLTSFNARKACYSCEIYSVGRNNTLRPFNYRGNLYCEIISERGDHEVKLKIEDEQGNKLSINPKRNTFRNRFRKKDEKVIYLYIDILDKEK